MKLKQKLVILAMVASVSLFANCITNVTSLVDQINQTKNVKAKQILMEKLEVELSVIDKKDLPEAKKL